MEVFLSFGLFTFDLTSLDAACLGCDVQVFDVLGDADAIDDVLDDVA